MFACSSRQLISVMSVGATKNDHCNNTTEAKTTDEPQTPFNCLFCCLLHEMKDKYRKQKQNVAGRRLRGVPVRAPCLEEPKAMTGIALVAVANQLTRSFNPATMRASLLPSRALHNRSRGKAIRFFTVIEQQKQNICKWETAATWSTSIQFSQNFGQLRQHAVTWTSYWLGGEASIPNRCNAFRCSSRLWRDQKTSYGPVHVCLSVAFILRGRTTTVTDGNTSVKKWPTAQ